MSSAREQQVAFWRVMKEGLSGGQTLLDTLKKAKDALKGQPLESTVDALVKEIQGAGVKSLWECMDTHSDALSLCVTTMVRAGEAGGVLDVVAGRILEGVEDGSFPVPGEKAEEKTEAVRYWRAFGRMLSSGVPIIHAMELIRDEIAGPQLREATNSIINTLENRGTIADAMERWPEVFPGEVCAAVAYGELEGDLDTQALRIANALEKGDLNLLPRSIRVGPKPSPEAAGTTRYVNQLILRAIDENASDIHLESAEEGRGRVRMRVDGALRDLEPPQGSFADVIARIKVMCDLDVNEHRVPQDGCIIFAFDSSGKGKGKFDARVSVVPTTAGERVVLRFFQRDAVQLLLEDIGLAGDDLEKVRSLCRLPNGIVMCCGPDGSGKTTLMYAMIKLISRSEVNVMSIEDPVEYHLPDVAQIEINPRAGVSMSRVARAVMRQDPDVIMIGEMRDLETVQTAVQMAVTGHLVITQTHANGAPSSVQRLIDVGVEPYLVGSSLGGVIAQRLARILCPKCKQKAKLTPDLMAQATAARAEVAAFFKSGRDLSMYTPKGCEHCGGLGYRGRTAIHEILIPTDRLRQAIAAAPGPDELRKVAIEEGMKPMLVNGLEKVAQGITSLVEVLRIVGG